MISIVIPAHDEANVIGRCLKTMTDGARRGELEIIVVCNGCSDDTAAIAGAWGDPVKVIETAVPSKSNALNLGDKAATGFPRFFVDADIILTIDAIRKTAAVLESGPVLAAAPRLSVDLTACRWPVRVYHEIWLQLPYIREKMLGSGVYAVSAEGRSRFDEFPNIIADDEFVRRSFVSSEKTSVDSATFTVIPPSNLLSLIHIGVRRLEGIREIRAIHPESHRAEVVRQRLFLFKKALNPLLWPAISVYAFVKAAIVLATAWARCRGQAKEWKRDETSR